MCMSIFANSGFLVGIKNNLCMFLYVIWEYANFTHTWQKGLNHKPLKLQVTVDEGVCWKCKAESKLKLQLSNKH